MCLVSLQDGQLVTFSEVGGMAELNNHRPIRIKNCKVKKQQQKRQQEQQRKW